MTTRWDPLLIVGTFLTCLVFAGHGLIPLAFLLVAGGLFLTPPGLVGCVAVALLVIAAIVAAQRPRRILTIIGAVLASGVWVTLLLWSDPLLNTAFFSLHFLGSLVYVFLYRPTTVVVDQ